MKKKLLIKLSLRQHYYEGCKPKSDFKVGVEIEKIGINSKNYKAVSYNGLKGILEFLKQYKSLNNGKFIHEDDFILGIDADFGNITLEPGAQIEISLNPRETIHDLAKEINFYNKTTALLAQDFDIASARIWIATFINIQRHRIIAEKTLRHNDKIFAKPWRAFFSYDEGNGRNSSCV
ncbi:MAG: hypothetical protein MZU95_04410 [Desulfomicrobium escambiense]|nr:hypothetical protein [Desulfomicrobium escambiense]